jgi:hypothetical protein
MGTHNDFLDAAIATTKKHSVGLLDARELQDSKPAELFARDVNDWASHVFLTSEGFSDSTG